MDYTSAPSAYAYVLLFTIIGVGFMVVTMLLSWVFRPYRPTREKLSPYECGAPVKGDAWIQFRIGFYIWGLIFVVFDVESIFVYPWAKVLRALPRAAVMEPTRMFAFVEMFIFFVILVVALIYAWRKGVLKWEGV